MIVPDFDSVIADLVIDLLSLFHTIEDVGSARIEGNNTQLPELMDAELVPEARIPEGVKEIRNMEKALIVIDQRINTQAIDIDFIAEVHRLIMEDLRPPPDGDGDHSPGKFRLNNSRIINPTSVFCSDRNLYFKMLSVADEGSREGQENWCAYMLRGLRDEIRKIDLLSNHSYLAEKIIQTALLHSEKEKRITSRERNMLKMAFEAGAVSATHFRDLFRDKSPQEISRRIRGLREKKLLLSLAEGSRKYVINLKAGLLRPGIMEALDQQDFLPPQVPANP